jgi:hypothetical protein
LIEFKKVRHVARLGKDSRTFRASPEARPGIGQTPDPYGPQTRLVGHFECHRSGSFTGAFGRQPASRNRPLPFEASRAAHCARRTPVLHRDGFPPPSTFRCSPERFGAHPSVPDAHRTSQDVHRNLRVPSSLSRLTGGPSSFAPELRLTARPAARSASALHRPPRFATGRLLTPTGTSGFHRASSRAHRSCPFRTSLLRSGRS